MKYPSSPESSTSPFPTECLSTLTLHASVLWYFDWIYYLLPKWTISSSLPVSLWDSCFSFGFDKTVGEDGVWHTLIYNLFSGRISSKSPITHKGFQAVILNGEIEDTVNKSSREGYKVNALKKSMWQRKMMWLWVVDTVRYTDLVTEIHTWNLYDHINHHHLNKFNKNI